MTALFVGCGNESKELENSNSDSTNVEEAQNVLMAKAASIESKNEKAESNERITNKSEWNNNEAYNLTQVDMPPLFDSLCIAADDPKSCSEEKLLSFIADNLIKPKGRNKKSLEQVLVVIEKDGSLQGLQYVASENKESCPECQQAAVDVIGKIEKWVPGTKDGKPVAVKMAIPVKFG